VAKLDNPKLFSLMLNKDQFKSLKAISETTMIPLSALVRLGVNMVIEKYQEELKKARKGKV